MPVRALARVNVAAIERNVALLRSRVGPAAQLCAVVKADASGHGAVPVARAALAGGASSLAVATAGEAAELRAAGLTAPVLILGAISNDELPVALAAGAEIVAWSERFVADVARLADGVSGPGVGRVRFRCTSSSTAGWDAWEPARWTRRWQWPSSSRPGPPGWYWPAP